jgi:predicted CXXCH cytochrome family protein
LQSALGAAAPEAIFEMGHSKRSIPFSDQKRGEGSYGEADPPHCKKKSRLRIIPAPNSKVASSTPRYLRVPLLAFALLCCLAAGSFAQKRPESVRGPSVASRAPRFDAPAAEFAGPEACKDCHKNETLEYEKTSHSKIVFPGQEYIQGCETCHGPGKAHSDAVQAAHGDDAGIAKALAEHPIFAFRGTAAENASRCLSCHISSRQQDRFEHSQHAGHGVSCGQCHAAHLVDEVKDASKAGLSYPQAYFFQVPQIAEESRWVRNSLLKQSEPALCYGCHVTVQAQFAQPEHHRVPEGLMKCSDCHNPHGSENVASLNNPGWETCVKCHVEKRGPFVFEHPAVKVEGCVTCHNPHGSANRMLLVRREGRQLCLQCHTGFHAQPQVPHSRLGFQTSGECVRCHVTVHGSSLDINFLR